MSKGNIVAGFGSLLGPADMAGRKPDLDGEYAIGPIFEQESEVLYHEAEEAAWDEVTDDVDTYLLELPGFERHYSLPSFRGGAMLEVEYTGNPEDSVTVAVYDNVPEDTYDAVRETEPSYDVIDVPTDNATVVAGDASSVPDSIPIFASKNLYEQMHENLEAVKDATGGDIVMDDEQQRQAIVGSPSEDPQERGEALYADRDHPDAGDDAPNWVEDAKAGMRQKHPVYQDRIDAASEQLADVVGEDAAEAFLQRFYETTYEPAIPGAQPVTMEQNERAVKAYRELMADVDADHGRVPTST